MRYSRNWRAVAGLGALTALICLTLFVVVSALASNPGDTVLPASAYPSSLPTSTLPGSLYSGLSFTTGVAPMDRPVGGSSHCSDPTLFPSLAAKFSSLKEYDNPNPTATGGYVASGNNDAAKFQLAQSGPTKAQTLEIDAQNAAILGIAIKGGNDNTAYDYTGLQYGPGIGQGWTPADGNLHSPASKFTISGTTETGSQFYTVSQLTVCYLPLATISGQAYVQTGSGNTPLPGDGVTVVDTTLNKVVAQQSGSTTDASGNYSVSVPVGDSYTLCIQSPGATYTQISPAAGTPCPSGSAPNGYTVSQLGSSGQGTRNFVFTQQYTVSGQIYDDMNLNGTFDPSSGLTPTDTTFGSGWAVLLYDTTTGSAAAVGSGTTGASGSYSFSAPLIQGHGYKLCEVPSSTDVSTTWVQTEPRPSSNTTCSGVVVGGRPALTWGAAFTGASSNVSQNFGNAQGVPCSSANAFGSGDIVGLMPAGSGDGCVKPNTFALATGTDPSMGGKQYVGVAVGDPTDTMHWAPVVEKVTFSDPLQANGTPQYTGLEYTAGSVTSPTQMQSCTVAAGDLLDPTNAADYGSTAPTDLRLNHSYAGLRAAETGAPVLPTGQTACLISITIAGASGGTGTMTAYVYMSADSHAWPT